MPLMDTNYKISAPQGDIAQLLPCCPAGRKGGFNLVSVCLSVSRGLGFGLHISCDPVSLVWQLGREEEVKTNAVFLISCVTDTKQR